MKTVSKYYLLMLIQVTGKQAVTNRYTSTNKSHYYYYYYFIVIIILLLLLLSLFPVKKLHFFTYEKQ